MTQLKMEWIFYPRSTRIAMYKVCAPGYECSGVQILVDFDDAVKDGLDILSISLGSRSFNQHDFTLGHSRGGRVIVKEEYNLISMSTR